MNLEPLRFAAFRSAGILPALFLACLAVRAFGGDPEPPPPPPWRPIPELPALLWYEDFEMDKKLFEKGKLKAELKEPTATSGAQVAEMVKADKENANIVLKLSLTKLAMPGGLNPKEIHIQFNLWSNDKGKVKVKFNHKDGDYSEDTAISKEKAWIPISMKLGTFRNKNNYAEAADVCTKMEIKVDPAEGRVPVVYVDDIFITYGVRPVDLAPRVLAMRKVVTDLTRTAAKEGFDFSPHTQEALKNAAKSGSARRKPKTVLVLGSTPGESDALAKALDRAAPKAKLAGFKFVPASAPNGSVLGGLEDARALLAYACHKSEAEMVVVAMGHADASSKGRVGDGLKALLARVTAAGCLPILCQIPVKADLDKKEKSKVEGFNNTAANVCKDAGVPYVDSTVAIKALPAGAAFEKSDLNAAGLDALAATAAEAVRHVETNVLGRK